jgi:ABC-type Zn2+ transport system substrate-binding protein/surface adhesin
MHKIAAAMATGIDRGKIFREAAASVHNFIVHLPNLRQVSLRAKIGYR